MEMLKMKGNASTIPPARESPVGRDGNGAGLVRAELAADADMDVEVDVTADNVGGVKALDKRSFEYIFRIVGAPWTVSRSSSRLLIPKFAKYSTGWFGVVRAMQDINSHEGVRGPFQGPFGNLTADLPIYNENKPTTGSAPATTATTATTTATATSSLTSPSKPHTLSSTPLHAPRYGLSNFYRGFSPTLLGMLPYAGVSFLTHDTVGDWLRQPKLAPYTTIPHSDKPPATTGTAQPYKRVQLTAPAELLSGALAGLVSQTSSYPLEVIRRRMQVAGAVGDGHRMRIAEAGKRIFAERGFRGFWVGLTIGYMKVVPMVAVSFYVYERSKWWLGI
ncbi:mitochondrial carrier protein LEU5 [Histoplasma mississippiense (nom. inval.)]|uniref:mitochondrial carrier protein LEU5 n=1 Tax=Ajellomyces capsulatus (strain NAm1 / WU24) TaxID=2059318 RepID=UPI000157CB23|nr:mitochondrial carrier protein LEU5 [Histoplasma mississippiense (nom. inval.)]EDN09350.1 mitochondrial carrier protein LEU5 [Histoplasma mississippiense (nom. inval.)]